MIIQVLHCPYCQGTDIVRHGQSPEGKQRYRCRECREGRGRTFLLDSSYAGQSPEVKQQIVEMAMNASGIRDTARVLHVRPTTVITELKERNVFAIIPVLCCRNLFYLLCRCSRITILKLVYFVCELKDL
jgi:InsA N-terminal domain/InsA C-terminal domain